MKKLAIVFLSLVLIVILSLAGLQGFLSRGLTGALNTHVFPLVRSSTGLDMAVSHASVNLFGGSVLLRDFSIRNLDGYEEPVLLSFDEAHVDVELSSLLARNPIAIKTLRVTNAQLTVERNRQGKYNVMELAEALQPEPVEEKPGVPDTDRPDEKTVPDRDEAEPSTPQEPLPPIPLHLRHLDVGLKLAYIDAEKDTPILLDLKLTGNDLFTVPNKKQPDSRLMLAGALTGSRSSFVTDLSAVFSPLTDPQSPTFNTSGSVLNIPSSLIGDLLKKNNMESPSFSIAPSITCTAGHLQGSTIELTLAELKLYDTLIGDTVLPLALTGTLSRPMLDLTSALQSLLSDQSLRIGTALGLRQLRKRTGIQDSGDGTDPLSGLQKQVEQILGVAPATNDTATGTAPAEDQKIEEAVDRIQQEIKALEQNEEVKEALRSLRDALRGK